MSCISASVFGGDDRWVCVSEVRGTHVLVPVLSSPVLQVTSPCSCSRRNSQSAHTHKQLGHIHHTREYTHRLDSQSHTHTFCSLVAVRVPGVLARSSRVFSWVEDPGKRERGRERRRERIQRRRREKKREKERRERRRREKRREKEEREGGEREEREEERRRREKRREKRRGERGGEGREERERRTGGESRGEREERGESRGGEKRRQETGERNVADSVTL